ncbi:neuroglian-like isoform X2 [Argonauta hians]
MKILVLLVTVLAICVVREFKSSHAQNSQWAAKESPVVPLQTKIPRKPVFLRRMTWAGYTDISYKCYKAEEGTPPIDHYWRWFDANGVMGNVTSSPNAPQKVSLDKDGSLVLQLRDDYRYRTYQCVYGNQYGVALTPKLRLKKSVLIGYETTKSSNYTVEVGDGFVARCEYISPGSPPGDFYWIQYDPVTKAETDLPAKRFFVNDEGSLIIPIVRDSDQKTYQCKNSNKVLKLVATVGTVHLKVKKNPNTGFGLPSQKGIRALYHSKFSSDAMFKEPFKLECVFSGIPQPKVTWKSPRGEIREGYSWEFASIAEADDGAFTCQAQNQYETLQPITMTVVVNGPPIWVSVPPRKLIVTEGSTVEFRCIARSVLNREKLVPVWTRNGNILKLRPFQAKDRLSLNGNGTILKFSDVRKSTDICNFQCSYSNKYGEIFHSTSFNVILKTQVILAPESQVISRGDVAVFNIKANVDALLSDKTKYTWYLRGNEIQTFAYTDIKIFPNYTLIINTTEMDEDRFEMFLGNYSVVIDNTVEVIVKFAILSKKPVTGGANMQDAGLDAKWIALIVAIVLFFIIFILLLCILFNRQSGDDYSVDKKERKAGHDPEKELADSGFHDLPRADDDPGVQNGDKISMSSAGKSIASDTDSMGEYSDTDGGSRFNEDGSFIGAYQRHETKGNESNV